MKQNEKLAVSKSKMHNAHPSLAPKSKRRKTTQAEAPEYPWREDSLLSLRSTSKCKLKAFQEPS